jgi:Ni,Fe-hydrogenase III large subunit
MEIIPGLPLEFESLPAALPVWRGQCDAPSWSAAARQVADEGGRLVALWGTGPFNCLDHRYVVNAAFSLPEGLAWLELPLAGTAPSCPDLAPYFPAAGRMQRAMTDLAGIAIIQGNDTRPWLDHGTWPSRTSTGTDYPFVRVEGDGVHEIPVGPVHAGIIEPGHFRFSVVGEKVLRLEERLGYTHKGIERRFTEIAPLEAHRLAGRVSGDSTVAYAWAYCMALESAASCTLPVRARWLRALLLERERVANHLGDLGALGNDAAFAFGLAQFSRLREDWLRLSKGLFGHRLMMDAIVPGGVGMDVTSEGASEMMRQCDDMEHEVALLRNIYDGHAGLQDRFIGTGVVSPELGTRLGLAGQAGRASGIAADLRCDQPWEPYDQLEVRMATQVNGDVAARVAVRFDEVFESLRLIRLLLKLLPPGEVVRPIAWPPQRSFGAGRVEGWRGEVFVALELDGVSEAPALRRCHCHSPSWQNWPVLEHAVIGNIVPDFPLINKSFNLSYSGHDL